MPQVRPRALITIQMDLHKLSILQVLIFSKVAFLLKISYLNFTSSSTICIPKSLKQNSSTGADFCYYAEGIAKKLTGELMCVLLTKFTNS